MPSGSYGWRYLDQVMCSSVECVFPVSLMKLSFAVEKEDVSFNQAFKRNIMFF